ncbi:MAG: GAF domain-containing protein, partial [Phycisphaerae bacterium]|nr:GAF domain-containing protein [Phycisphaerae bacterium]
MSGAKASAAPAEALRQLLDLSKKLGETSDLASVLGAVINALRDLLHADRATVFTYDRRSEELIIHVAHGVGGSGSEVRIPISGGIAGACATSRQIINIPDAYADPRFNRDVDRQTGYVTKSILAVPLLDDQGELVGVAQVLNAKSGTFDDDDSRLAQ